MTSFRAARRHKIRRNRQFHVNAIKRNVDHADFIPPVDFGRLPPPSDKPGRRVPQWAETLRRDLRVALWKLHRLGADALTTEEQGLIVFIANTEHASNLPDYALAFAQSAVTTSRSA